MLCFSTFFDTDHFKINFENIWENNFFKLHGRISFSVAGSKNRGFIGGITVARIWNPVTFEHFLP